LNNFKEEKNPLYKEAMERLANFVMIMWEDDQTIIPPISSHMGFYQLGQDNITVSLQVIRLGQIVVFDLLLCTGISVVFGLLMFSIVFEKYPRARNNLLGEYTVKSKTIGANGVAELDQISCVYPLIELNCTYNFIR